MGSSLDDLLAIDEHDLLQRLARRLVAADAQLMEDLIKLRQHHKLTQEQVGQRMGITQPAVAALERADADPKLSTLRRYALAVGALVQHVVTSQGTTTSSMISNETPPATGSAWTRKAVNVVDVQYTSSVFAVTIGKIGHVQ